MKGGKYGELSRELMIEAKSTSSTNGQTERDFRANINNPDNLATPEQAFHSQKHIFVALAKSEGKKQLYFSQQKNVVTVNQIPKNLQKN